MGVGGWCPADPITPRSSVAIVEGVVLHRLSSEAPVSDLFLFDRRASDPDVVVS